MFLSLNNRKTVSAFDKYKVGVTAKRQVPEDIERIVTAHGLRTSRDGKAGSISVHHVRTIHGSAVNTSSKPRRLLLFQYRAADAWPLVATGQPADWTKWNDLLLCGETDPIVPRVTAVPVRLPLPPAKNQGSIYENQRGLQNAYFKASAAAPAAKVA